jgi:CCR4-NOT transcription complex subunit 3
MEQFKICEKETKTKAYSKEGLSQANKLDPREVGYIVLPSSPWSFDPHIISGSLTLSTFFQRAKQTTRDWISEIVSTLETQLDEWEAEIERLSSGKGRKKNLAQV